MKKILKTKRVIYSVEINADETLNIRSEYVKVNGMWKYDGSPYQHAGMLICQCGGIDSLLSKCVDIEDLSTSVQDSNRQQEEAKEDAKVREAEERMAIEKAYNEAFSNDVTESNAKNIYTLLRYLNTKNWGSWKLPKMTIGYACHQYDCNGKTATTITLDEPVKVGGIFGTKYEFGAPHGHLNRYEPILDWAE